jgi:hypothetical protein
MVWIIMDRKGHFVAARKTEASKDEFIRPFPPGHFLVRHYPTP